MHSTLDVYDICPLIPRDVYRYLHSSFCSESSGTLTHKIRPLYLVSQCVLASG